jgi:hypothetical protein
VLDDARRFGMDARSLANLSQAANNLSDVTNKRAALSPPAIDGDDEGVWPENWETVQAFLAVSLQWRVVSRGGGGFAGMGGGVIAPMVPMFVGLDYAGVRAGLDAEGITVTPELWRGLRVMEAAACAVLNEEANR